MENRRSGSAKRAILQCIKGGLTVHVGGVAPLEEIISGPAHIADGSANLIGALRRAMATTGYSELKEFQRVGVVYAER